MFWQLFGASGLLILFCVGALGFLVGRQVERNELGEIEERLRSKALLLQEVIRGRQPEDDPELLKRLSQLAHDTRITFVDKQGRVLADSAGRADEMENHADRPEIMAALQGGEGKSVRYSTTVDNEQMYLAMKADLPNSRVAVIRVAYPLAGVQAKAAELRGLVWLTAAVTAIIALAGAFWLARRITRPLQELTQGAEKIGAGAYGHRVYVESRDEVGLLTKTFNYMSERLAAQFAQMDEDRQQLRTVLSSMVEGVVAIDADQRILFANDRAGLMLEFNHRAVGRFFWEMVRQRPLQELVRGVFVQGERECPEMNWVGPGDRSLTLQVARLPGSPPRGAVLVFHDTTRLRRLERLRQDFVANVSHELKTPLAVIQACVETLLDGAADDQSVRTSFLEKIADQGARLHNLIQDLLHLARIESETEVFTKEALELDQVVHESLEKHRTLAQSNKQRLDAAADTPGPVVAWADEEAVRQILDNLVDNALKYTPAEGAVHVSWGLRGKQVYVEVRDTGIGIAAADLPRIFERFYRVDRARSRELGGTGLGLSIVKHLAQAMHGSVCATSEVGKGSVFTVLLPSALEAAAQEPSARPVGSAF